MNTETKIQIIEISSSDDDEEEEGEGEKEEEKEKPFSESLEEKKLLSRNTLTILAAAEEDDDDDDCVILDYDPFADIDVSKKLSIKEEEEEFDILILSEKGKVACRDYPHSRHLCAVFPFVVTPHENHCSQCFCYICEILAPCNYWSEDTTGHCHATEHDPVWKTIRQSTPASNNS